MENKSESLLYNAARTGDVKSLNSVLKKYNFTSREIDIAFTLACMNGQYNIVYKFLTLDDEKLRPVLAKPLYLGFTNALDGFFKACQNDYLNIVKLILNNPDSKNRPDLETTGLAGLRCAASAGNLDIIKYMVESPELKKHLDIVHNDLSVFYNALINSQEDVIRYMIFDLYLEKSNEITKMMNQIWDVNFFDWVNKMFDKRDFNAKLKTELSYRDKYKLPVKKV